MDLIIWVDFRKTPPGRRLQSTWSMAKSGVEEEETLASSGVLHLVELATGGRRGSRHPLDREEQRNRSGAGTAP